MAGFPRIKTPGLAGEMSVGPEGDFDNGQKVTIAVSANSSDPINAKGAWFSASQPCFVRIGPSPTASDAARSIRLPQDCIVFWTFDVNDRVSVIRESVDGALYIIPAKMNTS